MLEAVGPGLPTEFLPPAGPRATWQEGLSYLWGAVTEELGRLLGLTLSHRIKLALAQDDQGEVRGPHATWTPWP